MIHPAWAVPVGYALGSIPFAYLAGLARGVDLRAHGSGNLGAANAVRVLGASTGAAVYVLDALKGFIAAFVLPRAMHFDPAGGWAIACAVAAVAGHVRPVFLAFRRGGKGVATASGAFLGLAPVETGIALLAFAIAFLLTGFASVGSLAGAAILPLTLLLLRPQDGLLLGVAAGLALFIFYAHRSNITRLRRGEEHRFDVLRRRRTQRPGSGG